MGCQESPQYSLESEPDTTSGIVGGATIPYDDSLTSKVLKIQVVFETTSTKTTTRTLIKEKYSICTAAAISKRLILTAAHCIKKNAQKYKVSIPIVGGEFVNFEADYLAIHADYEKKGVDLALLRMPSDLPKEVTILKLPERGQPFHLQVIGAAGFGDTSGRPSHVTDNGVLRATYLDVISYSPEAPIFVVDQTKGKGICMGDSGGPALVEHNEATYLVGVVASVTYPKKAPKDFDVCQSRGQYTNIYPYLDWIQKASADLLSK